MSRNLRDASARAMAAERGEMTMADQIREHPHVAPTELGRMLGCDPQWVCQLRWRDRNRKHFIKKQREYRRSAHA